METVSISNFSHSIAWLHCSLFGHRHFMCDIFSSSLDKDKPSTYPLRSAQRNLNKILLGNEDDLSNDSQRTCTVTQNRSESAKNMFELDTLISNVLNGTDTYMSTDGGSSQTMVEPANSAIAKEMNNTLAMRSSSSSTSTAASSSLAQNSSHSNSNSALRNDVKLSEYSEFAPCYAAIQQSHPQQMQSNNNTTTTNSNAATANANSLHSASMSQPSHSQQSNTNDSNGHLSKMFGGDDTSMLLNNNNNKSIQNTEHSTHVGGQQQMPSTPQSGRIRNSLMSDYNFSPVNGILSLSNTSGEYSLCRFDFIRFCRF